MSEKDRRSDYQNVFFFLPTNGSCEAMPLPLLVKHHFTARLFQHIFLCSLHEAKGAASTFPHSVYLRCHITVVHQGGHAQETRHHNKENLQWRGPRIWY